MYFKIYYNYAIDANEHRSAIKRGYKKTDKLLEGWDGYIPDMTLIEATDYILTQLQNFDYPLGPLAIDRGDVVYFPKHKKAYARTLSQWKYIKGFVSPTTPSGLVINTSIEGGV